MMKAPAAVKPATVVTWLASLPELDISVDEIVGAALGRKDGEILGVALGKSDGTSEGEKLGMSLGASDGMKVGIDDGLSDGTAVGESEAGVVEGSNVRTVIAPLSEKPLRASLMMSSRSLTSTRLFVRLVWILSSPIHTGTVADLLDLAPTVR